MDRERLPEPTAMTLATSTADGQPSARMVLLKGVDE
ncbi:MAG: pyridoxamine 5'-phosphate oxidase family protein, partial [Gemmatimonadaceae bacterium]